MAVTHLNQPHARWHEWTRSDRLRAAREGMRGAPNKAQFAALSGIGRNTVGRYEDPHYTGHTKSTVVAWASVTHFDLDWLWDGTIPQNDETPPDGGMPSGGDLRPRQDSNLRPADYMLELAAA